MPLFRFYRATCDGIHSLFSPTFRYRRKFENYVFGHDSDALIAFLKDNLPEVSLAKPRGHKLAGALLRERIRKDYYQFRGTFREALENRVAFQAKFRSKWTTRLTKEGRRERGQIAIEWIEAPAISSPEPASARLGSRPLFKTGFRGDHGNRSGGRRRICEAEELFFSTVRGKRILVLGPGITEPLDTNHINSFDVLATPKLHAGFWMRDLVEQGTDSPLTVVTYLNHKIVNAMRSNGAVNERVWDFARVKSRDDVRVLESLHTEVIGGEPVIGVMNSPDHLLMNTYGPLTGTAMVYDLLLAEPQSVFLMGFSFFVQDGKAYNSNYESASHTDDFTLNSLRTHGAFSNFLFLKNLYHFGLIEADDATARILSLSSSEYADQLDVRFGQKGPGSAPRNARDD